MSRIKDFVMYGLLIGVIVIMAVGLTYFSSNVSVVVAMLLLGSIGFMPMGFILGWMMLDPFMRAKTKRMLLKKNYGIVNFVTRGKRIVSKIKNFDDDLIWVGNACWNLAPGKIFKQEKEDDKDTKEHPILTEHINDILGVPVLFIDIDSMQPLTFHSEKTPIKPMEVGASLKGYVMNQLQKNLFFKRTMEITFTLVIVLIIVSLWFSYQASVDMANILELLESLRVSQPAVPIIQG